MRAGTRYDPIYIETAVRVIEKHGCIVNVDTVGRGPQRRWEGHDEVELFIEITKWTREDMAAWREIETSGKYEEVLSGFGGNVLADSAMKVQRMPFVTPEMTA